MLEWEGVSLAYRPGGHKIFEEFSLTVEDSTVLLGPTGSGKSTLLASVLGIVPEVDGIIRIGGRPVGRGGAAGRQWASYLPGANLLPPALTVSEYLTEVGRLDGTSLASARRHAQSMAERFELTGELGLHIRRLSDGIKRKTMIAAALLKPSEWLLVDEPTAGLDPEEQRLVLTLLQAESHHRGVLVATGQVDDTWVFTDREILLHSGRVIFDGPRPRLAEAARGHVFRLPPNEPGGEPNDRWWQPLPGRQGIKAYRPESPPLAVAIGPTVEDGYFWILLQAESELGGDRAGTTSPASLAQEAGPTTVDLPLHGKQVSDGQ